MQIFVTLSRCVCVCVRGLYYSRSNGPFDCDSTYESVCIAHSLSTEATQNFSARMCVCAHGETLCFVLALIVDSRFEHDQIFFSFLPFGSPSHLSCLSLTQYMSALCYN